MVDPVQSLRHAARGCFNSLKLCTSALELSCSRAEQVEFVEDIIRSSDKMGELLTDLEAAIERHSSPSHT